MATMSPSNAPAPPSVAALVVAERVRAVAAEAEAAAAGIAAAAGKLDASGADTAVAALLGNPASATRTSLSSTYLTAFLPEKYGAVGDGITDDTAAILATFAAVQAAKGGTVQFAAKHYLCLGALVVPNDGVSKQKPMRLQGTGANWDSYLTNPFNPANGGTILDLRYTGGDGLHPGKIDTRGGGVLEANGITFVSGGADNFPFLHATNTTLKVKDNAFIGNPANTAATCVQDAIIFGGLNFAAPGVLDADHTFQGYGSVVEDNYFGNVRRCVYARYYANSVRVVGNTVAATCGSPDATAGAFDVFGATGASRTTEGVVIRDNLVEMTGYVYGMVLDYARRCVVDGNQFWDGPVRTLGCVYLSANSSMNTLIDGLNQSGKPFVVEGTPGLNTIIFNLGSTGGVVAIQADQVRMGGVATNVTIGNLGTTDAWVDAMAGSAATHVNLVLRAKGAGAVLLNSHLALTACLATASPGGGNATGVAIVGSDNGGHVTFTTAAGIAVDASVVAVGFSVGFYAGVPPSAIVITALNAAAAGAGAWVTGRTANGFSIALHTPPAGATAMDFSFIVIGSY